MTTIKLVVISRGHGMDAKSIKYLELRYTMIQFLRIFVISFLM